MNRGPWIIAGAIVLAALLIAGTIVLTREEAPPTACDNYRAEVARVADGYEKHGYTNPKTGQRIENLSRADALVYAVLTVADERERPAGCEVMNECKKVPDDPSCVNKDDIEGFGNAP